MLERFSGENGSHKHGGYPGVNGSPLIGYIFITFPKITETFILREILELQRLGICLNLFSLLKPKRGGVVHPEAEVLAKETYYSSWIFSKGLWASHAYYLSHCPLRYFSVFARVVFGAAKQPVELAKTLVIFPKSVYFARIAQKAGIEHIHSPFASHNATCAMIISGLTKIRYSVTAHAYDIVYERPLLRERLSGALFVTTISRYNIALIKKRYGEVVGSRTHLIRCGVDLDYYRPRGISADSPGDGIFKMLCIASLRTVKGHKFLIEAVALMNAQHRNLRCILVGDGPLRRRIQSQVRKLRLGDTVKIVGDQTQREVLEWSQNADCVVLSSLREGIPVSLMEAMACGLPVVTTDASPGVSELVENNKSGLIVRPRDAKALAQALSFIQDNPAIAREFGRKAREKVEQEYDLEMNVKQLYELLMNAVGDEPAKV